jgi:hypothetical protein
MVTVVSPLATAGLVPSAIASPITTSHVRPASIGLNFMSIMIMVIFPFSFIMFLS